MSILKPIGTGQGYLKAGFLGFQGSGKTLTAILLAIGTRKHFGLKGPIAMFDTEKGSDYVQPLVKKETGMDLLGVKSRSFTDLMQFAMDCEKEGISVAIVDSITHPWRELCDAYLAELNEKRKRRADADHKTYRPLLKVEFQHWQVIKGQQFWQRWTDMYLNSSLHFIICGRAGYEYEYQENEEDGGKKELIKTGVKMRVENEFGFEPSLLVEMERDQEQNADGTWIIRRKATVIKDRFSVIDGKSCLNPTFDFFKPHVSLLIAGANTPVDTSMKTQTGADEEGNADWQREKRDRQILSEEIAGELEAAFPGQTKESKEKRASLAYEVFNTRSWTAIENMRSSQLRDGLAKIKEKLQPSAVPPSVDEWKARFDSSNTEAELDKFWTEEQRVHKTYDTQEQMAIIMAKDQAKARIATAEKQGKLV